jgi:hypothetical protein
MAAHLHAVSRTSNGNIFSRRYRLRNQEVKTFSLRTFGLKGVSS